MKPAPYWLSAGPGSAGSGTTLASLLPSVLDIWDGPGEVLIQSDTLMPAGIKHFSFRLTLRSKGTLTESMFYPSLSEMLTALKRRIKES